MKLEQIAVAVLISSSMLTPALAQDSNLSRASAASAESIGQTGQSVGWAVHAGSQFTVTAVKASAQGVELSLKGVSQGIETSATIAKSLAEAASIAVGSVVTVVAESTGYALMAAGRMIAFVPNEASRALLHRSERGTTAK